jgi:transcription termination factor Rho
MASTRRKQSARPARAGRRAPAEDQAESGEQPEQLAPAGPAAATDATDEATADAAPGTHEYEVRQVKKAPPLPGQPEADRPAELAELGALTVPELSERLRHYGLAVHPGIDRARQLVMFMRAGDRLKLDIRALGQLEVLPDGYGFLRTVRNAYLASPDDLYVAPALIRQHQLRAGMSVHGRVRAGRRKEKYYALATVDRVNDEDPGHTADWKPLDELTPVFPDRRILLETPKDPRNFSARVVDLVAPIGFGQRALIVSPPRAGKTMLLIALANAIAANYPDVKLLVFLVDERPEEVTFFQRHVEGDVIASTFDESPLRHVQVAERVNERARSLVESGHDVVVLLDSLTRLGRAYNAAARTTGRILSGGLESNALQKPKRFFGSARNIEGGGSLTILGTALIETGSKMDEVIFEEFKGTGNMELCLDRRLSDRRIFPAIDINRSGTRKEELLFTPEEIKRIWMLRKVLNELDPVEAMEMLTQKMKRTKVNGEFLMTIGS